MLPEGLPERYEPLALLGEGAMGQVFRVRDRVLLRTVAMKIVRHEILAQPRGLARFQEEARIVAQLQHPGIVPVMDLGALPDGRVWFTMKEIAGVSLRQVLRDLRAQTGSTRPEGVGFRRVVDLFQRACEAVGYAHARGVIHRDLKPAHVMVGEHGEVLVVDWGLARPIGARPAREALRSAPPVELPAREDTVFGSVSGTPGYLSPEQARGEAQAMRPTADVWSLGAILYVLLAGVAPYAGGTAREAIERARRAPPLPSPSRLVAHPIDEDLERLCLSALDPDPRRRPADAAVLAEQLADWLDGEGKRDRARVELVSAREALAEADAIARQADELAAREVADPEARDDLEDAVARKRARVQARRADAQKHLHLAIGHAPDLYAARDLLTDELLREHRAHEAAGRFSEAAALEPALHSHHRGRHAAYLSGEGALTLLTEVPCEVELLRVEARRRARVAVPERVLGHTPLLEVPLPMGNWVLVLRAPGRVEVAYPVRPAAASTGTASRPGRTSRRSSTSRAPRTSVRTRSSSPAGGPGSARTAPC